MTLAPPTISNQLHRDPEAFLAKLTIVAEGKTEIGFVRSLLERAYGSDYLNLGIWVTDGDGNSRTLQLLEALAKSGVQFSGFVDNEGNAQTRWAALKQQLGKRLFQWPSGNIEANIIDLIPESNLEEFIKDEEGESGIRRRTLAERLQIQSADFSDITANCPDIRSLILEAATGTVPAWLPADRKKEFKKHAEKWFKSEDGGRELADKIFKFSLWPKLITRLLPYLSAIREIVLLTELSEPSS